MGSRFSSEEKLLRHQKEELILESNSPKTFRFYEQYGYHHNPFEKHIQHRYKKKRNISFNGRYGKNDYLRTKSHSLNAILEELYSLRAEDTFDEKNHRHKYESGGSLIPRIKLKRSISSFKEERSYKPLYKMTSESEIFIRETSTSSIPNILINNENNEINTLMSENNISILLNDRSYEEISSKSDENYFAKNFDDCMKRLQLIEKEHDLIEKEDDDIQPCTLYKDKERVQTDQQEINTNTSTNENYNQARDFNYLENGLEDKKLCKNESHLETRRQSCGKIEDVEKSLKTGTTPTKNDETSAKKFEEPIESWYTNLKQQFEKEEQETQEQRTKEMTCRITGATLKNQTDKNKSEDEKEKDTRHYFSRLVKTNKSLIDEELPDPDKVKQLRAMFQESLNSTLKRRLDKKLGGSLQNISTRTAVQQMSRPLSAQCYRNDLFCEAGQKSDEEKKARDTPKKSEFQIENTKKKLFEKLERDLKVGKENKNRRVLQPKWTDTGSVSSGIGSDLSNYDTDLECYSREGTEQDEMTISDDDLLEEVKDKHYVQNEVLEKIRSFGTSVTYYGGEMITCSVGPLLSPTTQAIIEEISEKYGQQTHPARSFDEFYRKYVETIEPNRKKKVGRARSFGQNDVFQKPNVLSNTEIDMYKNDLEIEIGIKKPSGIQQNSLKRKVTKSASLEYNSEKPSIVPTATDSLNDLKTNIEGEVANNASENTINNDTIKNLKSETNSQFANKAENNNSVSEEKETECETTTATEKKTEKAATTVAKELLHSRSRSAPEELLVDKNPPNNKCEIISETVENPAKEIFFSYEKSIFNGKKNSDMEFEEFEVCESVSEKLEKLEKINPYDKSSDSQDSLARDDAELKKTEDHILLEEDDVNLVTASFKEKSEKQHEIVSEMPFPGENENTHGEKKDFKYNPSRWPIETSVMVDIQKNNEQTPKLITNGKTVAKTKIRLF